MHAVMWKVQCLPVDMQELKEIRNLDGCPLLEKLWLQENEISVIQARDHANTWMLQQHRIALYGCSSSRMASEMAPLWVQSDACRTSVQAPCARFSRGSSVDRANPQGSRTLRNTCFARHVNLDHQLTLLGTGRCGLRTRSPRSSTRPALCYVIALHPPHPRPTSCLPDQSLRSLRSGGNRPYGPAMHLFWRVGCAVHVCLPQGLDNLPRLKELYLYSNHITEIRGLSRLTQLEASPASAEDEHRAKGSVVSS